VVVSSALKMGNSDSKAKKKKKEGSDDGCIGNRKVRTIIIAAIIFAFFAFALAWLSYNEEGYRDAYNACQDSADSLGDFGVDVDCDDSWANAWAFVISGAVISMVGCIAAVVLFIIPGCDDKLGRVAGLVLIVGGVCYMIGWIWIIAKRRDDLDPFFEACDGVESDACDEFTEQANASLATMFAESLMAGGATILLGVDALFQIYDNEAFRLSSNLGLIMTVSFMGLGYYAQVCDADENILCSEADGVEAIATGYFVLVITTIVYIVLYICTCCTCDLKDKWFIRVILAVALVVGGALAAIGYYAYSGGIEDADVEDDGDPAGKETAYWIGYTIIMAGMCVVWALDIALDDVKNQKNTKK